MSKSLKTKEDVAECVEVKSPKYDKASLLKSKALSGYQKDFAKVILNENDYTIEEAIELLNKKLKEEV